LLTSSFEAVAYHLNYIENNSTNSIAIVSSGLTWPLLLQILASLATLLTLGHVKYSNCYYVEAVALTLTLLMGIPDYLLFRGVESNMQRLGQMLGIGIVTKTGPAFNVIIAVAIFLCGGAILRWYFLKQKAAADKKKKDKDMALEGGHITLSLVKARKRAKRRGKTHGKLSPGKPSPGKPSPGKPNATTAKYYIQGSVTQPGFKLVT